jgi:1-deoxy-D-xylulose-5-phosphate synthase
MTFSLSKSGEIANLKELSIPQLEQLAKEIRERILEVVSRNGGHLSSTLGAVDLIIGMHYVFDVKKDPFIFDVSHQAYAHKLLTGRWKEFDTLRQFGGLSGYTKPSESPYDYFSAGHSSTSISIAVGAGKAIKLKGEDRIPVVLIGDGALGSGMVYEALNELGERKYPVVIILNDNEMSIGRPIGALSKYLTRLKAGKFYQGIKEKVVKKMLHSLPSDFRYVAKKMEEFLAVNGIFFEELGLEYIGPIDGHNLEEIISTLQQAKEMGKPVVVHAKTIKGKGYRQAEGYYEHWHGVSPFDPKTGEPKSPPKLSATKVFAQTLEEIADRDPKVVGVTAAMPSGTGLKELLKKYPDRFWDVGIAEQHAVTSMAPLAKEGFKPFVAIYSTFLQRGYDQIIHDVCLDNYPVRFAIDRAGIVGADGETHQGVFDVGYLRILPNIRLFAPRDFGTLREAVKFAHKWEKSPIAFRYPRGAFDLPENLFPPTPFEEGRGEILIPGKRVWILGYGNGVGRGYQALKLLEERGEIAPGDVGLVDLRFIKPLDFQLLRQLEGDLWVVVSDNVEDGGVGELLKGVPFPTPQILSFEYPTIFIPHGSKREVEKWLGVAPMDIATKIGEFLRKKG